MDTSQDNQNLRVDIPEIKAFFFKHSTVTALILLLILQFIPNYGFLPWGSIWMRLQFEDLPISERLPEQIVYNKYIEKIYTTINQQQPHLPEEQKRLLANQQLQQMFQTNPNIRAEIAKVATQFKNEFSYSLNGKTYTYLPDIDTYYYLRLTNNVLKHNHLGDTLKEGLPWDAHVIAPLGANATAELHPYALASFHKLTTLFAPTTPLMQSLSYFPILAILATMIVLFFIGKQLNGLVSAFIIPTLFSLDYTVFQKSYFGYIDTDAYAFIFPTLFLFFFSNAFLTNKKTTNILYTVAASGTLALYAFAWKGWWSLLSISIATSLIFIAHQIFLNYKQHQPFLKETIRYSLIFLLFLLFSALFTSPLLSYREFNTLSFSQGRLIFINDAFGPFSFITIKNVARTDLWPNVYTTVGELQNIDLPTIIRDTGGASIMMLAITGVLLLLRTKNHTLFYGIFILLYLIAGIYAAFKARRFTLLLIIPTTIAASTSLTYFYNKLTVRYQSFPARIFLLGGLFLILSFLTSQHIANAEDFFTKTTPFMNKAFNDVLTTIKQNSPPNAIITSWWDFGHIFSAMSDRQVTFDGGSQNTPIAHWVGKFFTTSDEKEAVGIIRMLSCGSNTAYNLLSEQIKDDPVKVYHTLSHIILLSFDDAKKYLEKEGVHYPNAILKYTHCTPPETYVITSEDMRNKGGVWTHLGNWNLEHAHTWQVLKNKPANEAISTMINSFNYSQEQARKAYEKIQTISPQEAWPWIGPVWTYSRDTTACTNTADMITCGNILRVSKPNYQPILVLNDQHVSPHTFTYLDDTTKQFVTKTIDTNSTVGIILFADGTSTYYAILSSPELATSIFTRLMYFDAQGLKHFKPFIKRKIIYGGFISALQVDWNATLH